MAAAYLHHLLKNHPFVDGHKRAEALSLLFFLRANSPTLVPEPDELERATLAAASGQMEKGEPMASSDWWKTRSGSGFRKGDSAIARTFAAALGFSRDSFRHRTGSTGAVRAAYGDTLSGHSASAPTSPVDCQSLRRKTSPW
jgi:hypothetical protein